MSTRRTTWNAEIPVDLAGEDLAADGVAHVVRDERDITEPGFARGRLHDVGLLEQRVRLIGLGRQPVAEHVEHDDAPPRAQHVELVLPVVAARREAVQHEHGLGLLADRRQVDHEHVVVEQSPDAALTSPLVDLHHAANMPSCAPMTQPRTHTIAGPVGDLAVHEWGGTGAPTLLAHPTGFHGRVWAPVADRLVAAGRQVWSFDFRGHGDSTAPDPDSNADAYSWTGLRGRRARGGRSPRRRR